MGIMSLLTVLAGGFLYYRLFSGNWRLVSTGPGIGFTIGAIAGILLFLEGFLLVKPRAERMAKLGAEIQSAGGPPSAARTAELESIQTEIHNLGKYEFVLLLIAMLTMATARYWSF